MNHETTPSNASPHGKPRIQPTPILLPSSSRNSIDTHENVRLTQLDRLPSIDERIGRRMFREMHRHGVDLRFLTVISGRDRADWFPKIPGFLEHGANIENEIRTDGEKERTALEYRRRVVKLRV